jgi:hypothetical protein
MRRKIIYIGVVGCVILLLIAYAYSIKKYTSVIYDNWSIQLPSNYTEVYSTDDGESFLGDGQRYHVFLYDDTYDIENSLDWKTNKNTIVENLVIEILSTLIIDKAYELSFNQTYMYVEKYDGYGSSLFLVLIGDVLYVVEDIY